MSSPIFARRMSFNVKPIGSLNFYYKQSKLFQFVRRFVVGIYEDEMKSFRPDRKNQFFLLIFSLYPHQEYYIFYNGVPMQ